ncbi:MAG: hypothetical protein JSW71_17670 [Gemmatimonadota bacterium]|nr:MAG: hypothetical protein JSW71_17670 [Gemmatimonadota bacterium]
MTNVDTALAARLEQLERTTRRTRLLAIASGVLLLVTWLTAAAWQQAQTHQDAVRTRLLVIEDAEGRDRMVLGAPMPDGREYVGMKILNADGAEQFGLGLKADGSVSMGFDTKPGVGHPANRERLNMGVSATGQGWIRYLDNQTRARMFVQLDSADAPIIQLLDWPDDQRIVVRQIGFSGEQTFEWER